MDVPAPRPLLLSPRPTSALSLRTRLPLPLPSFLYTTNTLPYQVGDEEEEEEEEEEEDLSPPPELMRASLAFIHTLEHAVPSGSPPYSHCPLQSPAHQSHDGREYYVLVVAVQ